MRSKEGIQSLSRRKEIAEVFRKGLKAENENLRLYYLKEGEGLKLLVLVSKKVLKKAVQRNRMRRLIREWVRKRGERGKVIVVVKKWEGEMSLKAIAPQMEDLFASFRNEETCNCVN